MGTGAERVVVLGGGVAGMAAALLLARDGHRVTLVERDTLGSGEPQDAPSWTRRGIPHFLQPHALIPRARLELRRSLPDVHAALLGAGAQDIDVSAKRPGAAGPDGGDLQYVAARRPLLEWGLRRAMEAERDLEVVDASPVDGLRITDGIVDGVAVAGGVLDADLVVDALGRRTPTPQLLADAGFPSDPPAVSDCGVVYHCRYYRVRDGAALPDGPWLLSPRGDLGYLGFATFPGDNGTFSALFAVPTGVAEWRALNDERCFDAAAASVPMLRRWVDPAAVEPITSVMPMAGLRNTRRDTSASSAVGLVAIGDAAAHTDPVLAHGIAFALIHAREAAAAAGRHADPRDVAADHAAAIADDLRERFDLATGLDDQRLRLWLGEEVDFAHHTGDYELFTMVAAGAVAMTDERVFDTFVRRIGLLDSTRVLDDDVALRQHIDDRFAELRAASPPPAGPTRDEMLAILRDAAGPSSPVRSRHG